MQQLADLEAELLEEIAECTLDPLAYAQRHFPWGAGDLAGCNAKRLMNAPSEQAIDPLKRITGGEDSKVSDYNRRNRERASYSWPNLSRHEPRY